MAHRTILKTIPAIAHEAPYILDGLTMNNTGKRIKDALCRYRRFYRSCLCFCEKLSFPEKYDAYLRRLLDDDTTKPLA